MALLPVIFTFIIKDIGQSAVLLIFNELHFNFSVMYFEPFTKACKCVVIYICTCKEIS